VAVLSVDICKCRFFGHPKY